VQDPEFIILVFCSGELSIHSGPFFFHAEAGCETCEQVVLLLWSLLRNNNMATDLQRFTSSSCRRCFAACDWSQTPWRI